MVQALLDSDDPRVRLIHVPFRFSDSMSEMGRPGLAKVRALVRAVVGTWRARREGARSLYYCVAGAERFPLWRDAAFLALCRWRFDRTVYHFHAGGAGDYLRRAAGWERLLLTRAIGRPDLGIKLSATSPDDPEYFRARRVVVVPNGLGSPRDHPAGDSRGPREPGAPARLLSIGRLTASKGCFRVVELVADLRARGLDVSAELVGEADGPETSRRLSELVAERGLADHVALPGTLQGREKWDAFDRADFFVFLTDFEHENVPLVIIESMMCSLPVIASRWRGIPGLLDDGALGTLVDLESWPSVVDDVERALRDPARTHAAAERARAAWESRHTAAAYTTALVDALAADGSVRA
ncbi:MAG TPA: glycosyltransferase family 4 protein [Nocardioides sp.]|jgi:glycosyltransferase involved in cell wall biosynthesis|uniref:glycosyltransferase family 4 protein n=1 Tax=Nocardioides sp. TaxID=35761 RepID=UPI002E36046A|nr:glycosyltransferase family 4 protein [Nocardioides sp.]HEX3932295.1 glycosyltransferase family 4 protein [Nocardioides sp.]